MTIQDHKRFIEENNGVFNVHTLGKHLGWDRGDTLDKKAVSFNGQVDYDRGSKELNLKQLSVVLPSMLVGKKQLQGERRALVEGFCEAAGFSTVKPPENAPVAKIKRVNKTAAINEGSNEAHVYVRLFSDTINSLGADLTILIGSLAMIYLYYFGFIASEAYIQADLISKVANLPIYPIFGGTLSVLFLLVLLTINSRFDDANVFEWVVAYTNGEKKGLKISDVSEWLLWGYNVLMCQCRFFLNGSTGWWLTDLMLFLTGFIIPSVILIVGRILKNRIKTIKI